MNQFLRYLFTLLSLTVVSIGSFAQENFGIANSNYAGTNGTRLNPANISHSKIFTDINLAGFSAYASNNYVFLPKRNANTISSIIQNDIPDPQFADNNDTKFGYVNIAVHAPAFTVVMGDYSFGMQANVRAFADVRNIPQTLVNYAKEGLQYNPQQQTQYFHKSVRASALSFAEYGATFGRILKKQGNNLYTGGLTVNRLIGIGGAHFYIDEIDFMVQNDTVAQFFDFDARYAYNKPAFGSGKGWGISLGGNYMKMLKAVDFYSPHSKLGSCRTLDYKYRIGVSLIDIGSINFKQNAYVVTFNNSQTNWQNYAAVSPNNVQRIDSILTAQFSNTQLGRASFRSQLPTALSGQIDYNFENNIYLNASLVYRFWRKTNMGIQRQTILGVTPRFETKRFEIATPLSINQLKQVRLGAMVRLNNIIIGSDYLGSLLRKKNNVYGTDLYFNLKYSIFKNPACSNRGKRTRRSRRSNGRSTSPCPAYGNPFLLGR